MVREISHNIRKQWCWRVSVDGWGSRIRTKEGLQEQHNHGIYALCSLHPWGRDYNGLHRVCSNGAVFYIPFWNITETASNGSQMKPITEHEQESQISCVLYIWNGPCILYSLVANEHWDMYTDAPFIRSKPALRVWHTWITSIDKTRIERRNKR